MKKRFFYSVFASILLGANLLTGCSTANNNTQKDPVVSEDKRLKILDSAVSVDETGALNYIANDSIEESLMQEIRLFQKDKLLSSCFIFSEEAGGDQLQLRLICLDTGELLSEVILPSTNAYSPTIQVCGDQIVVSNAKNETIQVFDEQLKEVKTYTASGDSIFVNPEITTAYCLSYDEGLTKLDLQSGTTTILLDKEVRDLTLYSYVGEMISIRYIDCSTFDKKECYAGLNLETGVLESFAIDDSFSGLTYHSGLWAGEMQSDKHTFFVGTQEKPTTFYYELTYPTVILTENPTHLVLTQTDDTGAQTQSLLAYDTDGKFLSSCSLEAVDGTFFNQLVWLSNDNGYLLTLIDETGHDCLYFWDCSASTEGTDLTLTPYDKYQAAYGTALEESYYDKAHTLSEKYGVTVKIADQCDTNYSDKTALQELTPDTITTGLQVLETAFANYPTDFWKQLRYGSYRTLEINLMGEISDTGNIEGYYPTAFVQQENNKITMVLNIDMDKDILEQNIYHESSHIIDRVLEHNALYRKDAKYSEEKWYSLNPQEFVQLNPENGGYFYSYEMMPMDYYQEAFTPYFASDYGKSFPTEDRATLFETAMMMQHTSPEMRAKLTYYCDCIRDCFDTSTWETTTAWEKILK